MQGVKKFNNDVSTQHGIECFGVFSDAMLPIRALGVIDVAKMVRTVVLTAVGTVYGPGSRQVGHY